MSAFCKKESIAVKGSQLQVPRMPVKILAPRHVFLTVLFFVISFCAPAQSSNEIDSLENILSTTTSDSSRILVLNELSEMVVDIDPQMAISYAKNALDLAQKINNQQTQANALLNIGNGYYNLADYKNALSNYIKALQINETNSKLRGILVCSGSIGNVFLEMDQPELALKYFERTLQISTKLENKTGIASSLVAIGIVHSDNRDFNKSLTYTFQALDIFEETDNKAAAATCLNNIAESYQKLGDYPKALENISKALEIFETTGNKYGIAMALNNIGDFYFALSKYDKALYYYQSGLEKAILIGANDRIEASYKGLFQTYKEMGNYKKALAVNELFFRVHDSIYNAESSRQMAEMQTKFETQKKAKEIDLLTKDKIIKEEALKRQTIISTAMAVGGALFLLLALVAVRGYMQKKKVNNELALKNEKIESAYSIIEDQHKDIKDSIKYAQRLQEAIFPADSFKNAFADSGFVLFKPKDIVSGDFYWIETVQLADGNRNNEEAQSNSSNSELILFAAVDCTGHGVPGAFMSIVGYNLLKQAVKEHKKTKPSDILNEVNTGLSETLKQKEEDSIVKDGMDLALCSLQRNSSGSYLLQFSGANNPVWVVRNSSVKEAAELTEIKGDKFPIGIFMGEELRKFSNHEIELQKGDTLYIFTDGYADQFGGIKGKKFKNKPLQELLLSINDKTMKEQGEILEATFNDWKGELEQVDDVCIIGVRV